jgi:hypothetical protein
VHTLIENAVFITELSQQCFLTSDYQRVYFGSEFCERRIPALDAMKTVLGRAGELGMKFTLATPFVTDQGLARVEVLLQHLNSFQKGCEVVANDWGVLRLLRTRFPSLEPVVGRLLVKQKRCPTLTRVLKRAPAAALRKLAEGSKEKGLFFQTKLPRAMDDYYMGSNAGSVPILQKYLASLGAHRIELDNPAHGVRVALGNGIRAASLHVPYVYVSTTFFCLSAGCDDPQKSTLKRRPCTQQCSRYVFTLKHSSMPESLYLRGNTHFYRNEKVVLARMARMGVDRLVYAPAPPV